MPRASEAQTFPQGLRLYVEPCLLHGARRQRGIGSPAQVQSQQERPNAFRQRRKPDRDCFDPGRLPGEIHFLVEGRCHLPFLHQEAAMPRTDTPCQRMQLFGQRIRNMGGRMA